MCHQKAEMQGDKRKVLCLHVLQLGTVVPWYQLQWAWPPPPLWPCSCFPCVPLSWSVSAHCLQLFLVGIPCSWHVPCSLGFIFTGSNIAISKNASKDSKPHYTQPGLPGFLLKCRQKPPWLCNYACLHKLRVDHANICCQLDQQFLSLYCD